MDKYEITYQSGDELVFFNIECGRGDNILKIIIDETKKKRTSIRSSKEIS